MSSFFNLYIFLLVSSNTDLLSDLGNFNSLSIGSGDKRENNTNNSNLFNTSSTPAVLGDFGIGKKLLQFLFLLILDNTSYNNTLD